MISVDSIKRDIEVLGVEGLRKWIHYCECMVSGVIEVDEIYFCESFKGDHKKSKTFTMPHKAHKRGVFQTNKFVYYVLLLEQVIL